MYFIRSVCSPLIFMSNFCTNLLETIQVVWRYLVSHHLRFLQADHHLFRLHGLFILIYWFWSVLWHLESRRCLPCELSHSVVPAMHLEILTKEENLLHPLHLVIESCLIFYPLCLLWFSVTFMFNFPTFWRSFKWPWRCLVFHLLRFLQTDHHPFRLHSVSMPLFWFWHPIIFYGILNLANVADVSVANSTQQNDASDTLRGLYFVLFVGVWWLFPLLFQWRRSL